MEKVFFPYSTPTRTPPRPTLSARPNSRAVKNQMKNFALLSASHGNACYAGHTWERLLRRPHLGTLATLATPGNACYAGHTWERLLRRPHLGTLATLATPGNACYAGHTWERLLRRPHLGTLATLATPGNPSDLDRSCTCSSKFSSSSFSRTYTSIRVR